MLGNQHTYASSAQHYSSKAAVVCVDHGCNSLLLTVVLNTLREFLLQVLVHRTYPFRGSGVRELASLNVAHSDGSSHETTDNGASLLGVVSPPEPKMDGDGNFRSGKVEVSSKVMRQMMKPMIFGNHQRAFKLVTWAITAGTIS